MFEQASRLKLRFSYKGLSSVEDLWDIQVKKENNEYVSELNTIYCELETMKENHQKGLYITKTKEDKIIDLKMEIIKYIFETKKREKEEQESKIAKIEMKKRLLEKLASKQDSKYDNMTEDELLKEIDKL